MVVLPPTNEPVEYNSNIILYWNNVALDLNRLTHSIGGPQGGPTLSSRVLAILHLAIHDAYFAIKPSPNFGTYLDPNAPEESPYRLPPVLGATDYHNAVAGAAVTVLRQQYATPSPNIAFNTTDQLSQFIRNATRGFPGLDALSSGYRFGIDVGNAMLNLLAIKPGEPGADQGDYRPTPGRYKFDDEPSHPVRIQPINPNDPNGPTRAARIYNAPFYGLTVKRFAVQHVVNGVSVDHVIANPPVGFGMEDIIEYNDSVRDVIRMGGEPLSNATKRTPNQTAAAYYWAYDGVNLIGTPPRFYNQMLRKIAWDRKLEVESGGDNPDNADFARLFALVNVAMADAGIFSWQEKWFFEFWRPLSGIREHPLSQGGDPFFRSFGAPETNRNETSFKPPFPAYPSGHATFGAAAFQIARLYYRDRDGLPFNPDEPDNISFMFTSDELNGINRDLYQPYNPNVPITEQPGLVRTNSPREFSSLWEAIFENAISRIWLGVHWRFDAFAASDVLVPDPTQEDPSSPYKVLADGTTAYRPINEIRYQATGPRIDREGEFPIGGVPLGLDIANDIYQAGLRPTPVDKQPTGREKGGVMAYDLCDR